MSSDSSSSEGDSSTSASSSGSTTNSPSGSPSESNSCSSSGSPKISSSPSIRGASNYARPKVPSKEMPPTDHLPMGDTEEGIASSYYVEDLDDNEMGEDDLLELTAGLGLDEVGPSRLGSGKGKSYESYLQMLRERNERDEADIGGDALVDVADKSNSEAYSVSPERYALEMPSQSINLIPPPFMTTRWT